MRALVRIYCLRDIPLEDNAHQWLTWVIHSEFISVRGDGYQTHTEEVFKEMFYPHSSYFKRQYGFTVEELFGFLTTVEDRVICKLGSQNMIYGAHKMHQRWIEWDNRVNGNINDVVTDRCRDFSKGLFGDFFEANPDVPHTDSGQFLMIQPDDYSMSDLVFWVYPQNDAEHNILENLSFSFGDNADFISEGEFKGNVMNGHNIFEKPFVKDGEKYYCFTPMIPHRFLFHITEKLMSRNDEIDHYYTHHFMQQTSPIGRDIFLEQKVRNVLESFLSTVHFSSSVRYKIVEDGVEKKPELDIIGISDKATYIVEVKAHELSHKDKVKIKGTIDKFKGSVVEACHQSNRAKTSIFQNSPAQFISNNGTLTIDKSKPIYKIAVVFQHYSTLLGDFGKLVDAGFMKEEYRDTFIVSLFDLMVISEFIESEDEWIDYLNTHNEIYAKDFIYMDEIDILNGFVNYDLRDKVRKNNGRLIKYGTKEIDDEYSKTLFFPTQVE